MIPKARTSEKDDVYIFSEKVSEKVQEKLLEMWEKYATDFTAKYRGKNPFIKQDNSTSDSVRATSKKKEGST